MEKSGTPSWSAISQVMQSALHPPVGFSFKMVGLSTIRMAEIGLHIQFLHRAMQVHLEISISMIDTPILPLMGPMVQHLHTITTVVMEPIHQGNPIVLLSIHSQTHLLRRLHPVRLVGGALTQIQRMARVTSARTIAMPRTPSWRAPL